MPYVNPHAKTYSFPPVTHLTYLSSLQKPFIHLINIMHTLDGKPCVLDIGQPDLVDNNVVLSLPETTNLVKYQNKNSYPIKTNKKGKNQKYKKDYTKKLLKD